MRDGEHHLFYCNTIIGDINVNDINTITLDDSESNHAVSVLRIKIGQRIRITDGNGVIYDCQCTDINKRSISCGIIDKKHVPKITPELTLLIGLPDKERFETVLEHATALGVSRIIPIAADNCRKSWWGNWEGARQRFLSKMIVSMKQCLYPYVPILDAPMSFSEAVNTCTGALIVADQDGKCLNDAELLPHKKINCLVGPPGGFSHEETTHLKSFTAIPVITVKIASSRLRSELAATVLCSRVIGAYLC